MSYIVYKSDELYHYGVKGMRWGVRRWQNEDGSLTEAGRRHYDIKEARIAARAQRAAARAEAKSAKIQNKMYQKAQKAEAKEYRKNLKKENRLEKIETEKLKLELKQMKKDIAYQRGMKFGEAFIPAFGRSLGESFGRTAGNTMGEIANPLAWKKAKTERIAAEANKLNAKASKADKDLARKKYDDGFDDRKQAIDELNAKTNQMNAQNTAYSNVTDRLRAEKDAAQTRFNLSEAGQKAKAEERAIQSKREEANLKKAEADYTNAKFNNSTVGRDIASRKADAEVTNAQAKLAGAEAGKMNARANQTKAIGDARKAKAEGEAELTRAQGEKAINDAKASNYDAVLKNNNDYDLQVNKQNNEYYLKKDKQEQDYKIKSSEAANKATTDAYAMKAKFENEQLKIMQDTVREANKMTFDTIQKYNEQQHQANIFKIKENSRLETYRSLKSDLGDARAILSRPNASPSQRAEAYSIINNARQFNARLEAANSTNVPLLQITNRMPSEYHFI
jgi:hypothetical protein